MTSRPLLSLAALCALFTLCACKPDSDALHGYVEGEYVYVAPTTDGILQTLSVARGDAVSAGQDLFSLDLTNLQAAAASAKAAAAQAEAQWANLTKGQRPEELDIILKQRRQAQATLENAQKDYERVHSLQGTGAVSQTEQDARKADFDTAQARVAELTAQLTAAHLGARADEIDAARAAVDVAEQRVVQIEKQLKEAAPQASQAGHIEDTDFRPGEFVAAGKPVVSLLPPENVKVRFFLPQARLPHFPPGTKIRVTCDGCDKPVDATVTYVSSQAEFTPPVIYSIESRDKLVFMLEATPETYTPVLRPGLPVDIAPVTP